MSIVNAIPLIAAGDDGYSLSRSLRFRSSASAYFNRTPASAGNRKTWTWSGWVKRGALGANAPIFQSGHPTAPWFLAQFETDNTFQVSFSAGVSGGTYTTQVFRDPSAWYHIVIAVDTTQATASNRLKLYVNGAQVTAFSSTNYPSLNFDTQVNNTLSHTIGAFSTNYFDGYLTEVNFIDGQALAPTAFGAFSIYNQWLPKKYAGTYGTNGFYLPFTNNASAATLGNDFSGNSNTWTTNNISVTAGSTYDSMTDVPTLTSATAANFATLNPIDTSASPTITNGNLSMTSTGATWKSTRSTIGMTTGKFYFEASVTANSTDMQIGIGSASLAITAEFTAANPSVVYSGGDGSKWLNGTNSAYGSAYTLGQVIGVAFDADARTVTFYINNTSQGTITTGWSTGLTWVVEFTMYGRSGGSTAGWINFGQQPFNYSPPSGYVALNTFNL